MKLKYFEQLKADTEMIKERAKIIAQEANEKAEQTDAPSIKLWQVLVFFGIVSFLTFLVVVLTS